MSVEFLDKTGLTYFWGKIKAWCNSVFATISHTHASSDVIAMTSYSKASASSAIATSDSLNAAIGKLEYKVDSYDDSNYVHKTGTETIDGDKTFTGAFKIARNWANITAQNNHVDFTDNTHNSEWAGFWYLNDKNGVHGMTTSAWRYANSVLVNARLVVLPDDTTKYVGTLWMAYPGSSISGAFAPYSNNTTNLGTPNARWKEVFAVSGTINTSDERLKTPAEDVPDGVLDAWAGVRWCQFQMLDAVERKGAENARIHGGLVAQRVAEAFRARGLDAARYGLFCHDAWDALGPVYGEDGEIAVPAQDAGDLYSLRYEEAFSMEAAYMRRENARLKKRVSDLEERLAALELRLGSE